MKISTNGIEPYITKDNSMIRELIHPSRQTGTTMSLAEATIEKGCTTYLHVHTCSQEIYYILEGNGRMTAGEETFDVQSGDSIHIMPGMPHNIANSGINQLKILCFCHPSYDHQDTLLINNDRNDSKL